jgi:hypothetical protein
MSNSVYPNLLFGNLVFCWEAVEDAKLYRIIVDSPTDTILDVLLDVKDLKLDMNCLLNFVYPEDCCPISPLLPHVVRAATINKKNGVYTAMAEFTLLGREISERFMKFRDSIESDKQTDLDSLLNAILKPPKIFASKEGSFEPGCVLLEFSPDPSFNSSTSNFTAYASYTSPPRPWPGGFPP